ncbi:MAG: hypothetical protein ACFFDN_17450 [Candidatus Hodarchaeota archaeon]
MIYDIGKLVKGDKWGKGWWNQIASPTGKWFSGVLTYNSENRKLYFFDYDRTFEFNIDDISVNIIDIGKISNLSLLQIREKDGGTYLYCSMAGIIMNSNIDSQKRRDLAYVNNTAICRIIDYLQKHQKIKSFK